MTRVNCPQCHRVLDVLPGQEQIYSLCPACGTQFIPETICAESNQAITKLPRRRLPANKRGSKPAASITSSMTPHWTQAKRTFAVVVIALIAVGLMGRVFDIFFMDFMVVPLLAFPITVIVMLMYSLMFLTSSDRPLPKMRWLPWAFVIGCLFGIGAVWLWTLQNENINFAQAIVSSIVAAPIFGVLFTIAAAWAVIFYQFLRFVSRKIEKASKLDDDDIRSAQDKNPESQS
jgi:hypothetical protein